MKKILVGSDFSGVGAFNQSLKRLDINYEEVFACDIDKYARQTFILNYGMPKYYPTNVYERIIPLVPLDIYMTSPPCQSFSLAGKRKGKNDSRGILFFNSLEFIKINNPRYFIFENVKGLLSDDGGKTFSEWVRLLGGKSVNGSITLFPDENSVAYHLYYDVLNSKNFGVPQNRERVFLIGIRDDVDNNFTFPKNIVLKKTMTDLLEKEIDEKYNLSDKMVETLKRHKNIIIDNETPIVSATIHAGYFKMGGRDQQYVTTSLEKYYLSDKLLDWLQKHSKKRANKDFKPLDSNTKIAPCVTTHTGKNGIEDIYIKSGTKQKIRRLTPRECFRLMDFPEDFIYDVSDTQAYKQAGNSIVVAVLTEIIKKFNLL